MGGSAAARVSVDHEQPRRDIEKLGAYLDWHGGLTLDYLFDGTSPCLHRMQSAHRGARQRGGEWC